MRSKFHLLSVAKWCVLWRLNDVEAFTGTRAMRFTAVSTSTSIEYGTRLGALTERQIQFWNDVEAGLNGLENHWKNRGQDVNRIWTFTERAQGNLPLPSHNIPGFEPSEEYIEGLRTQPFWDVTADPELFPWARDLEAKSFIIKKEYESRLQNSIFATDSVWQNQVMGPGWSAIRLQRLGVWNMENCRKFPETFRLIKSLNIPLAVRGVCFARQTPGTGVQPHSDGRNFILTSHLGLEVPEECWFEVGGIRKGWEEGKLTTVDTSFVHSTGNPSNQERHVLIIDFWHPDLTEAERAALEFIYDLRNKYESGQVPVRGIVKRRNESRIASFWGSLVGNR